LKKDAKVYDVFKEQPSAKLGFDEVRTLAKKEKADVITGLNQGGGLYGSEIEILNTGAIKSIEGFKGIRGKWTNPNISKDTEATAMIYPAAGRPKDLVRLYWEGKQTALNQLRAGKPELAKRTDVTAEKFKSLYPELTFKGLPDEKVVLTFSSKPISVSAPSTSNLLTGGITSKGISSQISITETTPKPRQTSSILSSKPSIKPRSTSISITPSKSIPISSKIQSVKLQPTKSTSIVSSIKSVKVKPPSLTSPSILSSTSIKVTPTKPSLKITSPAPSRIITSPAPSSKLKSLPPSSRLGSIKYPSLKSPKPSSRLPIGRFSDTAVKGAERAKKPIAAGLFLFRSAEKERPKKVKPRKDFLGNVKTDHIVGLFRRTEILTGDKRTARQLKRDKKVKVGVTSQIIKKKRGRNKKKKEETILISSKLGKKRFKL